MELIGRDTQRKSFRHYTQSSESKLIAVYGRRRIGKTFLIREHFSDDLTFEVSGLYQGDMSDQLSHFAQALVKAGYYEATLAPPEDWMSAFEMLGLYIDTLKGKKKKILFIDELPWLDTPRSKFLMAFENFWNSYCTKRKDILLVICGSAASWMIQKIVKNKGGLHNRVAEHINLKPFSLYETEKYLISKGIKWSKYDITQLYMIVGGIPYYLDKVQKGESVAQFVNRACFTEGGPLYDEYEILYASLFNNNERHEEIVEILSKTKTGIKRKEIIAKSKAGSGGTLTKVLDELDKSGFIQKVIPYGARKNNALYKLVDNFTIFYWKYMQSRGKRITDDWTKKASGPSWNSWSGFAFERVCFAHIPQIKKALLLQAIECEISTWNSTDAQIDMLIDRADNIVHIGEIKFAIADYEITSVYAKNLRNKIASFRSLKANGRKVLWLTMITTFGVKDNMHSKELVQNEVTLKDLFSKG